MNQNSNPALQALLPAIWPLERIELQFGSPAFWRLHAWWPLLAFTLAFAVLEVFSLDRVIAREWYYNVHASQWLGAGSGEWWARGLLHTGGRWMVRGVAVTALVLWALSFGVKGLRQWRQSAGFVLLSMLSATLIVGGLKAVTNVDCPWDLAGFGGDSPYVALFADRPDALTRAQCFPGAHASSGFALMCFYFVFRDRSRRIARGMLWGGLAVGIAFSIGQEARGAHFLSHDLTSAAIVWFVQLGLYAWYRRGGRPAPQMRASSGR
jgi:membrane-associated PAP2 superfamily phosphatase